MEITTDLKAIRFLPNTKVSHDYEGHNVKTFSYRELIQRQIPAIGIPCKENGLIVIDVDVAGESHKHDGREFWTNFCAEYGIPQTYTVHTASGGYHFYFRLPAGLNPDTFSPPAQLALGVDVKYRGWVGAPPTAGYQVLLGNITTIAEAPPSLLAFMTNKKASSPTFDNPQLGITLTAHKPFTDVQLQELRAKITWLQSNGTLSRSEWRDGLFALKAGIDDLALLDEFVDMWTLNRSYVEGDEHEARTIVERADKYGPIGPGTIFSILNAVARREGAIAIDSPYSAEEIINKSKVIYTFNKDGGLRIEPSESNAAALIGAMYDDNDLYHDIRSDLYMYRGRSYSDTELVNIILPKLQSTSEGLGLCKFRKGQVAAGLDILLSARQKDPHIEYLKSLSWDGVPRIETFFQTYTGVEDNEYHRRVSKNFWVALAARGLRAGCKFDSVVILEGAEGIRKSSLVQAIGGEYTFAPARRDAFENLDELRKMHQSVIVELPELMGLINESSEKVKAFLASPFDYIRALYARKAMKKLRGFVFVGTTNNDKYISTSMGLRRFWPVKITSEEIDIDGVIRDRDQLFAEAIQYYKDGFQFYDMPYELLKDRAGDKIQRDPIADAIQEIAGEENIVDTISIYRRLEAGGYVSKGLTTRLRDRIEESLKVVGFLSFKDSDGRFKWRRRMPITNNTFCGLDISELI